jgi:hypothetical protein
MKNHKAPEKIYLQIDPEGEKATDYLDGITWCEDKINDTDVEYIRSDLTKSHRGTS